MKKTKKIGIILIIFVVMNLFFTNITRATNLDNATEEANNFIGQGQILANEIVENAEFIEELIPIAQALRTVGIGILLCIIVIMGIKWVSAKPDEVAKLKQQSVGLLVSAIVIIAGSTIWTIALRIASHL